MGAPVPQTMEDSLPFVPQERVQNRTPEQIVDVFVPQNMEDYAGIMCDFPKERVQNRFVDVLVPHQAGWFASYS